MSKNVTNFIEQIAKHRAKLGSSYRALEEVTGIKYSALAAMQTGNRPVGEQSAQRLASAFSLRGEEREAFVLSALNTSKERVLEAVKDYPAEVLNAFGLLLLAQGVKPKQIVGCDMEASPASGTTLRLSLTGGRELRLESRLVPVR